MEPVASLPFFAIIHFAILTRARYCQEIHEPDPYGAVSKCTKGTCMAFFIFICESYKVPNKRQKLSSVNVYQRRAPRGPGKLPVLSIHLPAESTPAMVC